jgi:hypothetical protein
VTTTQTGSAQTGSARLWRLHLPANDDGHQVALTVRIDQDRQTGRDRVWVAVGSRYRRLPLTVPEAWALFRLLAEALDTAGEPPEFIRAEITATKK